MAIKATDVRRAILFTYAVSFVSTESDSSRVLIGFVRDIGEGFEHLGLASISSCWSLTKTSQKCPGVVVAMLQ
eukprot:1128302-Pyramimonas_sp.AAC.1